MQLILYEPRVFSRLSNSGMYSYTSSLHLYLLVGFCKKAVTSLSVYGQVPAEI